MNRIPKDDTNMLKRDFNTQNEREKEHWKTTGKFSAHTKTNANGTRLIELCQLDNLSHVDFAQEEPEEAEDMLLTHPKDERYSDRPRGNIVPRPEENTGRTG